MKGPGELAERTVQGLHGALFTALPQLGLTDPILDIGCGSGAWLARFAQHGYTNLVGVDLDTSQFGLPGVTCVRANVDRGELDLGDRRFRLVSAIELFEHLENPGLALAQVAHYLVEGGLFLMTTPNIHSVISRLRHLFIGSLRAFDDRTDPTHVMAISMRFVEKVFPRHGLELVRTWGYPGRGTLTARPIVAAVYRPVEPLLKRVIPGDTLCVLARKVPVANTR